MAVVIVKKTGHSIVASLDNMLRYIRNIESWLACHATSLATRADRKSRCSLIHPVRLGRACQSVKVNLTPLAPMEYQAFRSESLFQNGVRPTLDERMNIWNDVQQLYPDLPQGKYPFGGQQ